MEEIKGCIENDHIEKAEDLLGFVIGEIAIAAQQSKMLEIAKKLLELSEMIGNGASVSIECRRHEGLSPTMIFRVDWENDFHFRHELSFVRLASQPDDILKIVAYARREYAQSVNPT